MTDLTRNKTISKNLGLAINLISSLVAFGANLIINFFLSPYIVKELGVEANGFITLANNFVAYASLVSIALNSMAGRFITIKIHQGDLEGANKYYSSVTVANIIFALVMFIPSVVVVFYLEHIISIPRHLLLDVKMLFFLLFINYLMSTAFSTWGTATFVTNKLYLQSVRTMSSQLLRVIIIVILFTLLQPSVYFVGIGTLTATFYITLYSLYYKKKLLPDLRVRKRYLDLSSLRELVASGIWNTITSAGNLLLSGLDLLIANMFIGPKEMGMLALAKTLPNVMTQLGSTLRSVFAPSLTINYAKGDLEGVKKDLKKSMKLIGVILTIPLSVLFVFGEEFYTLWVPSEDALVLQVLSALTIFGLIFTSGVQTLYNIFAVVNKLKMNSILMLLSGGVSLLVVFILLKTTNLGIFAVAAVSSIINLARNLFFTVPFGAKYLKLKWHTFFPEVFYSVISIMLSLLIGFAVKQMFIIESWLMLASCAVIVSILGFIVNVFIVLNKEERNHLLNIFKRKISMIRK